MTQTNDLPFHATTTLLSLVVRVSKWKACGQAKAVAHRNRHNSAQVGRFLFPSIV
jgi:hypothetical protein